MEILKSIFVIILEMSVVSSIIGIVTLILKNILKYKISPKWLNIIWIVFLISLINPIRFRSSFSIYNLINYQDFLIKENQEFLINEALDKHTNIESYINSNSEISQLENININNKKLSKTILTEEMVIIIDNILNMLVIAYVLGLFISVTVNLVTNIKIYNNTKNKFDNIRLKNIMEKVKINVEIKESIDLICQNIINSPAVYGVFKKKLVLTKHILDLSDDEIELVFLHELLHVKNKDISLNRFVQILKTIYWFNPIVYYLLDNVKKEIEFVNDENVIEKLEDNKRKLYCKTLIKIALASNDKFCSTLSIVSRATDLEDRIKMIKGKDKFLKNKMLIISLVLTVVLGITVCFATNRITSSENNLDKIMEKSKEDVETVGDANIYENTEKAVLKNEVAQVLVDKYMKLNNIVNPIEGELKITSNYSKRIHPITKDELIHNGIDIKAEQGDKILSIADGIIEYVGYETQKGNVIEIKHINKENNEIYYSYYAHLSKVDVEVGDNVNVGDKIGEAGSTGMATGPHLHLEIRNSEKKAINPSTVLDI